MIFKNNSTLVNGGIPYRMALAGGWIDQPFISRHNPSPPGAMVVARLEPEFLFMERCGMGTSTRKAAIKLWGDHLPTGDPEKLVRELYHAENQGKAEPSGSQDMAGLIYPGINRLDYDINFEGGYFPAKVTPCTDPTQAHWLEESIYLLPIAQRPYGYNPLGEKNLDREWIRRLGQSGKDCFQAILDQNLTGLGAAMNECMACWEEILPHTVRHATIQLDLVRIWKYYANRYAGAMYSGCGGGYLFVAASEPVKGGFKVKISL